MLGGEAKLDRAGLLLAPAAAKGEFEPDPPSAPSGEADEAKELNPEALNFSDEVCAASFDADDSEG